MGIELTYKKLGMTRLYTEDGISIPVTVLEADSNVVVQKKNEETDGYSALQIGSGSRRDKTISKGLKGHYTKAGIEGTVVIQIVVSAEGKPTRPVIIKSAHELLDKAALEGVMKLEFTPALQRARAVPVYMAIPVKFDLR